MKCLGDLFPERDLNQPLSQTVERLWNCISLMLRTLSLLNLAYPLEIYSWLDSHGKLIRNTLSLEKRVVPTRCMRLSKGSGHSQCHGQHQRLKPSRKKEKQEGSPKTLSSLPPFQLDSMKKDPEQDARLGKAISQLATTLFTIQRTIQDEKSRPSSPLTEMISSQDFEMQDSLSSQSDLHNTQIRMQEITSRLDELQAALLGFQSSDSSPSSLLMSLSSLHGYMLSHFAEIHSELNSGIEKKEDGRGRPRTSRTEENITKVHECITEDPCCSLESIEMETDGIPATRYKSKELNTPAQLLRFVVAALEIVTMNSQ
ncbi:unnamed protein product [Darwinula stevensoni]|uniref:Uncharacterized protein n=1 Tax=Darwinula stevensoni TaxID=69355 RepID=A0A7R9A0R4_9CRUS|nr:unnamed protein product [Darwinula stevensoni]CAG0886118.1 unnamed protein product [Darwinula stevensoni]